MQDREEGGGRERRMAAMPNVTAQRSPVQPGGRSGGGKGRQWPNALRIGLVLAR